uniref:AMP-dependent synthetase/ligase domain-containing protein n=1 Tax=Ciona savignyi TaxID=51511 RepID=H2ZDR6_CIOSA
MIQQSPFPDIIIPKVPFNVYMLKHLTLFEKKVAFIDGESGRSYTFADVRRDVMKCTSELVRLGIQPGDVVAMCCSNCLEYPVITIAAASCSALVTTCNPTYTEAEMTKQFSHSQPIAVFCDEENYLELTNVAKKVPSIKHIFIAASSKKYPSLKDLIRNASLDGYPVYNKINPTEDTFLLPYSSGTTGLPKGVMLTHYNMVSITELCKISFLSTPNDIFYLVLPMFHIYGMMSVMKSLVKGTTMVISKRFTVESFFGLVERYKITSLLAVPPMVLAMYNSPLNSKYDLSSLIRVFCGAAPLPLGVSVEVQKKLNVSLIQGWGLSEAVPLTASFGGAIPLASVGVITANTLIKIVDLGSGKVLGPNEEGEICCKGPQVMKGYYKNPSATTQCIDYDGWFHTGDIGYYDEHGLLYVIDRLKELIKYKGFQVAPAELEAELLKHPVCY